jgi:hypothetical protein
MDVEGIDERMLVGERNRADFVVYIYEGGNHAKNISWSVDSYLLTDGDLPRVFDWLSENLPENCCWSLGVVTSQARASSAEVQVDWVVGADVLNSGDLTLAEQAIAHEMLARRHRVTFES